MKIERIFDFLLRYVSHFPTYDVLCHKKDGKWKKYNIEEVYDTVNNLSLGLLHIGVKKNDKVAIISNNRPEWNFVDFACQQIGAITVPLYPNISEADYRFILQDADVQFIFVADNEILQKVQNATEGLPILRIFSFDPIHGIDFWETLTKSYQEENISELLTLKEEITGDDLLTIIYTSGTTGKPKGVMLTHNNILSNVLALSKISPLEEGFHCRVLSFLPVCHIFERTAIYFYFYFGLCIYYSENLESISSNLKEVKPYTFTTVPRLLEKIYSRIITHGSTLKGIRKVIFKWALRVGTNYDHSRVNNSWYKFQLRLANKLVFTKWREVLGGEIKYIISGAATLQPGLTKIFWAAGIKVLEGYGLTETSPAVCFTLPSGIGAKIGYVGPPVEGVSIKIAKDGEILVKGPNVMKGYYNRPDLTREVIDEDGWFHTGDIGTVDENNFLKITDRKKEIFKTSGGKYISPQVLENKIKESILVDQIMVLGENKRFPAAIIVPGEEALRTWCDEQNIPYTCLKDVLSYQQVQDKFDEEIARHNSTFSQFEKIKKFLLVPESWGINTGELTPTLKIKRSFILDKYRDQIDSIYK